MSMTMCQLVQSGESCPTSCHSPAGVSSIVNLLWPQRAIDDRANVVRVCGTGVPVLEACDDLAA
jgi:hypothetical protein